MLIHVFRDLKSECVILDFCALEIFLQSAVQPGWAQSWENVPVSMKPALK